MHTAARDFERLVYKPHGTVEESGRTRTVNNTEQETAPNDDVAVYHDERARVIAEHLQQGHMVHLHAVHHVVFRHEVDDYAFLVGFRPDDARGFADFGCVAVLVLGVRFFPVLHGVFSL